MNLLSRCAVYALVAGSLTGSWSCLIYNEGLLLDGAGGAGATGGTSAGTGGTGGSCVGICTHLLISEVVVTPTRAEFVEVFNPRDMSVSLDNVFLADFADYYTVTGGSPTVASTDFLVQFPAGSSIAAGERLVVSIDTAGNFSGEYGQQPDYEIVNMAGTFAAGSSGLANTDEMIVLFEWDGGSATVKDLDYVIWGNTSDAVDKTGVSSYLGDTPADQQSAVAPPLGAMALHRCDDDEPGESKSEGNGTIEHDETSENLSAAFRTGPPTPRASPPAGTCP